jgi:hypothetical protein
VWQPDIHYAIVPGNEELIAAQKKSEEIVFQPEGEVLIQNNRLKSVRFLPH